MFVMGVFLYMYVCYGKNLIYTLFSWKYAVLGTCL